MATTPQTTTFLEIIEDNDGEYEFLPLERCESLSKAIATAWKRHDNFLESRNGEDFRDNECLNVHEDDFVKAIAKDGRVVTASEDKNRHRIYRLIQLAVNSTISVIG